jgi:DNA/RNA endonuclease YhcR with UshA esterase domain
VRGSTEVLAGGTITSDAEGRFSVASLPAGTHDLYVDPETLPDGVVLCENPVALTIEPAVTRFVRLRTRGGCLVPIAEAEAGPQPAPVVVRGIVTSFPGQLRGAYTYIQDETGGIRLFSSALEGLGIEIGDRIEIAGTLSLFNDDFQVSDLTLREHVADAGTVTADDVTTGGIAAAGAIPAAPMQGTLVRVEAAEVTGAFGSGGVNIRNAFIDDGTGATQIRIEGGVATEAEAQAFFELGKCYDITGVVGNFRGAGQLFPRSLDDATEVPCS